MAPNLSLVIEFSSPVHCHNWYLCFCFLSLFGGFRIICRSRFCLSFAPCHDLKMHSLFLFYCHLALSLYQYIYTVNMPVGNYKAYCHWPRSVFPQHQCQERNSKLCSFQLLWQRIFPPSELISCLSRYADMSLRGYQCELSLPKSSVTAVGDMGSMRRQQTAIMFLDKAPWLAYFLTWLTSNGHKPQLILSLLNGK